eukprot:1156242-Pelagomonas_calceolata.AAC.1
MMGYRRMCVLFDSNFDLKVFRTNDGKSLLSCSPLGDLGRQLPSKPSAVCTSNPLNLLTFLMTPLSRSLNRYDGVQKGVRAVRFKGFPHQ